MNEILRKILIAILVIAVIGFVVFGLTYAGLGYKKFFGPKSKNIDRQIWEETKSRTNAAIQDINTRMLEHSKATDDIEKEAICGYLRNSYPTFDANKITDYKVRAFFNKCKYGA